MTQATSRIDEHVREAATETVAKAQQYMLSIQYEEGYWWGELESNPTIEAEYLMLTHILGAPDPERWRKIANYILGRQQEDGSWAQYYGAPGNLSTCVECYTALKMAGIPANSPAMTKAREFILSKGGVPNTRVFTKIWLAMLGQYPWKNLPAMPPEVMFLPTWFPLNIYEFSSWARATIVPMTIILTEKPTTPIPEFAAIPELFPRQNGHKPSTNGLSRPIASWRTLFNGADKVLRLYEKAPIKPGRAWAKGLAAQWILARQEADGSWGGIQPPWVYSLICLKHLGYPLDHPAMKMGLQGFEGFAIEEDDTWRVQACISPVWDTCLALIAMLESGIPPDNPAMESATRWLIDKQILRGGDWQVKAPETPPGGWAFEFANNNYPDIDDVSEVLIALKMARLPGDEDKCRVAAVERGVSWLLGVQSANGGWAAFDKDNDRTYLSSIPFADFGESLDPPKRRRYRPRGGSLRQAGLRPHLRTNPEGLRLHPRGSGRGRPLVRPVGSELHLRCRRRAARPPSHRRGHEPTLRAQGSSLAHAASEHRRRLGRKLRLLRRPRIEGQRPQHRLPDRMGAPGPHRRGGGPFPGNAQGHPIPAPDPAGRRLMGRALFHRHRLPRLRRRTSTNEAARPWRPFLPGLGHGRRFHDQLPSLPQLLAPHRPGPLPQRRVNRGLPPHRQFPHVDPRRGLRLLSQPHQDPLRKFHRGSLLLPKAKRQHVSNLYAYCRTVDDLGDEAEGDRRDLLEQWREDLERCYDGTPNHPVMVALQDTIQRYRIPREPFLKLIEANLMDQEVARYETFEDLLYYCDRSANPCGRLFLYVFDYRDEERQQLSDYTCTALQLTNFWQDVNRDWQKGRVYLPLEDMKAHGVTEEQLARARLRRQLPPAHGLPGGADSSDVPPGRAAAAPYRGRRKGRRRPVHSRRHGRAGRDRKTGL